MQDVEVIESAGAAAVALDPVRARLLRELAVPSSAAGLAGRVGLARQKVGYHLKALEAHGLVELAEERRHGGITERVLRATAASYVVSPAAVTASAADPDAATTTCRPATSSPWQVGWSGRSAPWPAGRRDRHAPADPDDRHPHRLPVGRRPGRLRRRPDRRGARPGRALPPRRRAPAPARRRRPPTARGAPVSTSPNVPHRLEFSVEVPGTPEQVWQAIATAKGMSAWFLPTEMEEREGGSLHFTMGPEMGSDGHVTAGSRPTAWSTRRTGPPSWARTRRP
jgi:DNA-binding transcriptional ArsR family regulator